MTKRQDEAKAKVEALHRDLQRGVRTLINSAEWLRWLETAARFHHYSFNNQMLIMIQRPDATQVASYKVWQSLGRQVRKGEKSISIFAPMTRKVENATTGDLESRLVGFRGVGVFDVSQTDGEPLPERPESTLLEGEAPAGLWEALATIVDMEGYTLERGDCHGANGYTQPSTRTIRVREDVSDAQAVKTLAHEVAHMILHTDGDGFNDAALHRGIAEVEAESTAYLIARMHGMEVDSYSLPYVAGWGGKDGEDAIRKTGERVIKTARRVSALTLAATGEPATAAA